jgi:hypothetical protein
MLRGSWVLVIPVAAALLLGLSGCRKSLPRDTPEATIASARQVVMDGRADRLAEFIAADNPDMRAVVNRLGVFLGNVQKLSDAVQQRFPEEVAKLKADAAEAAASGKATGVLAQMATQMRGGRRPPPSAGGEMRSAFDDALKQFFADPYGWLQDSQGRLTTDYVDDETVAVLWDGKPLFAPLGLTMRQQDDEKWYFVLPTNAPGVSNFMPKTREQYDVFGSIIATFDNVAKDLTRDVQNGRVKSLNDLSRSAGEKTFIPVVMTVFAYSKVTEAPRRAARESAAASGAEQPRPAPATSGKK